MAFMKWWTFQQLKSRKAGTRKDAVDRLGADGGRRAVKALDALGWQPATEEQRVLRAIAAAEFGKAADGGAVAVERLMAVLKDQRNPNRRSVVEALSQMGDARATKAVVAAVKDTDSTVRVASVDALTEVHDAHVAQILVVALKDKD